MNYDELAAGRDTDALIAEQVMGRIIYRGPVPQEDLQILEDGGSWIGVPGLGLQPTTETCPRYSTDIAAAFLVVAEMERRGFWCEMRTPFNQSERTTCGGYWAGFTPHEVSGWNGTADFWTPSATLPLSICRAALKTLAYKEKLNQEETK